MLLIFYLFLAILREKEILKNHLLARFMGCKRHKLLLFTVFVKAAFVLFSQPEAVK